MDGLGLDPGYEIVRMRTGCFRGDRISFLRLPGSGEPITEGVVSSPPGEVDLDSHLPKEAWKCLFKLLFIQSAMGMTSLGAGPSEVLDRAQPQLTSRRFLVQ